MKEKPKTPTQVIREMGIDCVINWDRLTEAEQWNLVEFFKSLNGKRSDYLNKNILCPHGAGIKKEK